MKAAPRQSRAGQDRWLVSYADLVTLLFAFFTTLYAAQAVDASRVATEASPDVTSPVSEHIVGDDVQDDEARSSDDLRDRLAASLEDDVRLQRADIARDGRGLVVSLPEQATFHVGSAEVTAEAKPVIARVLAAIDSDAYVLRVEGHTDDVPIRTVRYPSNWELSTARAGAVVAYLINDLRVPPDRLAAAGYAEFHPRVPNDSVVNRARNRRIDIVVIEREGTTGSEESRE